MNTFNRKTSSLAGLLAVGLFSSLATYAAEGSSATGTSPMCHQENRRVAVWPVGGHPSKAVQIPRYETRTLTVCDHEKTMSKPARTASKETYGPRQR
jgi:hypothetical protein